MVQVAWLFYETYCEVCISFALILDTKNFFKTLPYIPGKYFVQAFLMYGLCGASVLKSLPDHFVVSWYKYMGLNPGPSLDLAYSKKSFSQPIKKQ